MILRKNYRMFGMGILIACSIFYQASVFADSTGNTGISSGWTILNYPVRSGGSYGGYYLAFYWGGCAMGNPFTGGSCACPSGYTAGLSGQNIDQYGDRFKEYQCYKY